MKTYKMVIQPALKAQDRHAIEDKLKELGYNVSGGGQFVDGTESDITFEKGKKA